MTYFILKKCYSEKVARGNQPWVWPPKNVAITTIPNTKKGWVKLVNRIYKKHGSGTYRIMRSQFEGEMNGWKPVIYFTIDHHKKYTIQKRYTQYRANPGKHQPFFKHHIKHSKIIRHPKIGNHIIF